MACVAYDVCMDVTESDHKPVFGIFEARIRPGRDHDGLACGSFHRQVYEEANKRRANHFLLGKTQGKKTEGSGGGGGGGGGGGVGGGGERGGGAGGTKVVAEENDAEGEKRNKENAHSTVCSIM